MNMVADIGLPDYYDQTGVITTPQHWIVMSGGSWVVCVGWGAACTIQPMGTLFLWLGRADCHRLQDDAAQMFTIGQSDPTPADTEDSVWINLPDQPVEN